jgi:hypothetical protein
VLPQMLPPGYERAATFRGTGSGAALPNPHVWGSGYAVTFTDGSGRVTVVVNSDDELGTGDWEPALTTPGTRRLEIQKRDVLVIVRTAPDEEVPLVVVGEDLPAETVLEVAGSLRDAEGTGE